MKLSCVTTTFNDTDLLLQSVNSILNQSFKDFQYIIVDDGSSKETHAILEALDDPRITVIYQANDGVSGARNKALEQVKGEYVCFLDSDDIRPNWSFQTFMSIIERDDPDLVLCRGILSELRGGLMPFYDSNTFEHIRHLQDQEGDASTINALTQLIEPQPANKVIRTEMLRKAHIGFPNTHFFEDVFFHTAVVSNARRISLIHSPCFTYFRRYMRPQTTSTNGDIRLDTIAVAKLTLEVFAQSPQFHDPLHRAAVVTSCFKIVEWCSTTISHQLRDQFNDAARGLVALMDPLYQHFPADIPAGLHEITEMRRYIERLAHA